ncbi:hypothetical protein Lser_V15G16491 [Lactuca serriola]
MELVLCGQWPTLVMTKPVSVDHLWRMKKKITFSA